MFIPDFMVLHLGLNPLDQLEVLLGQVGVVGDRLCFLLLHEAGVEKVMEENPEQTSFLRYLKIYKKQPFAAGLMLHKQQPKL